MGTSRRPRSPSPSLVQATWLCQVPRHVASVWESSTGRRVCDLDAGEDAYVQGQAFSPDGRNLVTIASTGPLTGQRMSAIDVWEVPSGRKRFGTTVPDDVGESVMFLRDNNHLLAIGASKQAGGMARLWDLRDQSIRTFPIPAATNIRALALDKAERRLAVGFIDAKSEGYLQLFDLPTGKPLADAMVMDDVISSAAFSPAGTRLLLGCTSGEDAAGMIVFLDPSTGERVLSFDAAAGMVTQFAFSPDGRLLAAATTEVSGCFGQGQSQVSIWDLTGTARSTR